MLNGLAFELDTGVLDLSFAGAADVAITGNSLANTLRGGDGDDSLLGGEGNDTLFGGIGDDLFVIGRDDAGTTSITDFSGGDVLDLTDVVDGLADPGADADTVLDLFDVAGNTEVRTAEDGFTNAVAVIENVGTDSLSLDSDGNVTVSGAV